MLFRSPHAPRPFLPYPPPLPPTSSSSFCALGAPPPPCCYSSTGPPCCVASPSLLFAFRWSIVEVNEEMHAAAAMDDSMSGTTAVVAPAAGGALNSLPHTPFSTSGRRGQAGVAARHRANSTPHH